ncbi:DsbE family thiol:disulfide interchange protein [Cereibacter sphaeroides]|uniref:DsbE family thiol:disulfide interchange protein n=1 Tax=Cereibacter sphaeroides TaxID=1063 RepID=UPI000F51F476|nr:DsbE family thiol:disulfide interchange protein [Cereibacter sphaeroides]AZB64803.1 DsbE family thiol:disulfide interchange protein [Cereibacter sphaeroides]AZB67258.1 DsbE family thiol:disulfide interchange protein [Cereibacter sphaeroides]
MAKVLMFVPPVLFAGLAAMFFVGMQRENPDELPSALAGKPAPAVRTEPLGDHPPFEDAILRAPGVKLVNYWASWCAPCRVEAPTLEALAADGVEIHGVNYKDKPENAEAFLAELGNPYATMGADASGRMALDWGVYGVPETYVIDGKGRIVLRFPGPVTERVLEETIRPAMEKAAAAAR